MAYLNLTEEKSVRVISTLVVFLTLLAGPVHAQDQNGVGSSGPSITLNVSQYDVTPKSFKKAAMYALADRNWEVTDAEADRVRGSLIGRSYVKVEITHLGDLVVIRFPSSRGKENWLVNLRGPFLKGLLLFSE